MTARPQSRDRAITGLRGATMAMVLAGVTGTAAVAGLMARHDSQSSVPLPSVTTVRPSAGGQQPRVAVPRQVVVVVHAPPGRPMQGNVAIAALKQLSARTAGPTPTSPTVTPAPPAAVPAATSSGSDPA